MQKPAPGGGGVRRGNHGLQHNSKARETATSDGAELKKVFNETSHYIQTYSFRYLAYQK